MRGASQDQLAGGGQPDFPLPARAEPGGRGQPGARGARRGSRSWQEGWWHLLYLELCGWELAGWPPLAELGLGSP